MALSLWRSGASPGAAVAFFLGNPTLNPAVVVWILLALGWQWALLRLAFGAALVVFGAILATRLVGGVGLALPEATAALLRSEEAGPWIQRWVRALARFTLMLIPVMVGLTLLLGAGRAWLFPAVSPDWGEGWLPLLGMALAGTLFPIPTGAEIPIVQTMMGHGLGSGPAAALLLTLAPLSVPSLAMMAHVFPLRLVAVLGGLTAVVGVAAGLLAMALGLR